jgi:LysR family transcriptional regulator, hydrogen peroxide-inducible genes activator
MTLLQLSYIVKLAEMESFSRSAESLNISQPALSLQVSKLEEEMGMPLFKRTSTGVFVTDEGRIFVSKALELLQMAETLKQMSVELENKPEGELHIGMIPTLAPYWVPLFIETFTNTYPHIKLVIREMITSDIIQQLKSGTLHAGFLSTPLHAPGIEFEPIFYERFYLYVSEKHVLFPAEAIDLNNLNLKDLWYLSEGNCFQNQVNAACAMADKLHESQNLIYLSNSIESLCHIVERGRGMTFIPELATLSVSPDKEDLIKEIEGNQPIREISMATSRLAKSDRLTRYFLEVALKAIPQRMRQKPKEQLLDPNIKIPN